MYLIRLSNIDFHTFEEAILSGDMECAINLKNSISIEVVDLQSELKCDSFLFSDLVLSTSSKSPFENNVILAGKGWRLYLYFKFLNFLMLILGEIPLTIWKRSAPGQKTVKIDGIERIFQGKSIKKIQSDFTRKYLLILDDSGNLTVWDFKR